MKKRWNKYFEELGEIKGSSVHYITFESTEPLEIERVQPTCSKCVQYLDYINNRLSIRYTAEILPPHYIKHNIKQSFMEGVMLYYKDGTSELLKIGGEIRGNEK